MNTNFENINWELLSKNLAMEANDLEKAELEKWLALDPRNRKLYEMLAKDGLDYNLFQSVQRLDVDQALAKVKMKKGKVRSIVLPKLARIAAIIIFAVGISWFMIYSLGSSKMINVETGEGERSEIILADGSEVSINEHSKLVYPKKFMEKNRKVQLEGEAFFKITPDKTKPFVVDMDEVYVQVLGTEFNISNYRQREEITVLVAEGSVQLSAKKTGSDALTLKKGNIGNYNKNSEALSYINNGNSNMIAWKTKYLVFSNEPLEKVVSKLNEVYLIDLSVDEKLKSRNISAIYNNQPVDMILQILESTLDVSVIKISENEYEIVSKSK